MKSNPLLNIFKGKVIKLQLHPTLSNVMLLECVFKVHKLIFLLHNLSVSALLN